jgi:hypothetical protein
VHESCGDSFLATDTGTRRAGFYHRTPDRSWAWRDADAFTCGMVRVDRKSLKSALKSTNNGRMRLRSGRSRTCILWQAAYVQRRNG